MSLTVGELKKILDFYPETMPIKIWTGPGRDVTLLSEYLSLDKTELYFDIGNEE